MQARLLRCNEMLRRAPALPETQFCILLLRHAVGFADMLKSTIVAPYRQFWLVLIGQPQG